MYDSAAAFCSKNGLVITTYRGHEDGNNIPSFQAEKYAPLLGVSAAWILFGEEAGAPKQLKYSQETMTGGVADAKYTGGHYAKKNLAAQKVPVLGYASGTNEKNAINWDADIPIDYVDPPHTIANLDKISALQIQGDSMSPRYYHGEIIFLNRAKMPDMGRDCVIDTRDGVTHIKRFMRIDKDNLYLEQLNPAREIKIARSDVIGLYAVVGRN